MKEARFQQLRKKGEKSSMEAKAQEVLAWTVDLFRLAEVPEKDQGPAIAKTWSVLLMGGLYVPDIAYMKQATRSILAETEIIKVQLI